MGNQTCQLLPDGAAGEALREMTGPSRIPITDCVACEQCSEKEEPTGAPVVTAHLHGAVGGYRRLGLTKFFSDVQSRHARKRRQGNTKDISFELEPCAGVFDPPLVGLVAYGVDVARMACTSYNIFMYPWDGPDVQTAGLEPSFVCSASAMKFNGKHNLDFSAWSNDRVPYMSRKDRDYISQHSSLESAYDDISNLTLLWDALRAANLPLVVHCPVDLFFLLAVFEQRPLPQDPGEFAHLVCRCFRTVYDASSFMATSITSADVAIVMIFTSFFTP